MLPSSMLASHTASELSTNTSTSAPSNGEGEGNAACGQAHDPAQAVDEAGDTSVAGGADTRQPHHQHHGSDSITSPPVSPPSKPGKSILRRRSLPVGVDSMRLPLCCCPCPEIVRVCVSIPVQVYCA